MAVKNYSASDSSLLSPHFRVSEFRCKCGGTHDILIADELYLKLEELYEALDCSHINLSSGFRCVSHDKAVGGSGTGQHTKGYAADISCYGKDGKLISSKIVCCKAQDVGFKGIANINTSYTHTHVDMREGKEWHGDETRGMSYCIPVHDFYQYFGIRKEDGFVKKGIDISWCQTQVDWSKVVTDFAIIQAGGGRVKRKNDDMFESHYAGAKSKNIPVGAYWFCRALTVQEAIDEADIFISIMLGKKFEYPVYMDVELDSQFSLGKVKLSQIVRAFLERVEAAGYWVGLYMSRGHLQSYIEDDIKKRYALWIAEWRSKLNYNGDVGMWQYSEKGSVRGITGNVDLDECYVDYPKKVKEKGLNGFGTEIVVHPAEKKEITVEMTVDGKKYSGKLQEA